MRQCAAPTRSADAPNCCAIRSVRRQSSDSRKPSISVAPCANSPKITARCVMDLSPGGRHTPRTRRAGRIRQLCTRPRFALSSETPAMGQEFGACGGIRRWGMGRMRKPPSLRFPPLREGNRAGRAGSPASRGEPRGACRLSRFARGTALGVQALPLREGNRAGRAGSPASRGEPRRAPVRFPLRAGGTLRRGSKPQSSRNLPPRRRNDANLQTLHRR